MADFDPTPIGQAEVIAGERGHSSNRFFDGDQTDVTGVMPDDAREGVMQSRVRHLANRYSVTTDHGEVLGHHTTDVVLRQRVRYDNTRIAREPTYVFSSVSV